MSDQECVRWRNELLKSNPLLDDRDLNLIAFMAQKHLRPEEADRFVRVARSAGRLHDLRKLVAGEKGVLAAASDIEPGEQNSYQEVILQ